tara:strand:+ start:4461 stop:4871 length:411 start_codon:yes stop_codon:yes gene_type:complete
MSLKTRTGRELQIPTQIDVPQDLRRNFLVGKFFDDLINYLFKSFQILTDDMPFVNVEDDVLISGSERLIVTAISTITLNPDPINDETMVIKSDTTETITIDGNGKTIDGNASLVINTQYEVVTLNFIEELDAWYII